MRTIRAKIVRRLTRLAIRQVVRVDRALAGRRIPIQHRPPMNAARALAVERTRAYLREKRKARSSHRPKRMRTAAGFPARGLPRGRPEGSRRAAMEEQSRPAQKKSL